MPRVSRLRMLRRDRGGVATVVAVLLGGGVLLGAGALVVDVGQLYSEREQLQSGADSAAGRVALACARQLDSCVENLDAAEAAADANARDGRANITEVCGYDSKTPRRILPCTGDHPDNLAACLGDVPTGANYVEVHARTEVDDGNYLLPFGLAQAVMTGVDGVTVAACSRVAWGTPSGGLAMTICSAEWSAATSNGTVYAPAPPAVPPAAREVVLRVKSGRGGTGPCATRGSGAGLPGGFGWVDLVDPDVCEMTISATGTYTVDSGASPDSDCSERLDELVTSRKAVAVPIYDESTGSGTRGTYSLDGMAAFVVTGYGNVNHLRPKDRASWLPGSTASCSSGELCVYGYFTEEFLPWSGGIGSLPSLGATAIKTIG